MAPANHFPLRAKRSRLILLLTPVIAWVSPLQSANWDTKTGISVGSYFSDNICRNASDEDGQFVGTVTPDIRVRGSGARANLSLRAAVEYNSLADADLTCPAGSNANFRDNREDFIPRVNFNGDLELVEDWLTLEADAYASQNRTNPFAAGGEDNLDGSGNTNITYRYSAGAAVQRRLFEDTDLLLRYTYDEQYNERSIIGDSSEERVDLELGTDPGTSLFAAQVLGRYSKVDYEQSINRPEFSTELSYVAFQIGVQFNESFRIDGLVGEERNDFVSVFQDNDGSYWNSGVTWTPNGRIELSAGYGERFFGNTPRLSFSYRHKRSSLQLAYERTVNANRNLRTVARFLEVDDPLLDDPSLLPGTPLDGQGVPVVPAAGVVVNEGFRLGYRVTGRRTNIGLFATDSRQTRFEDGNEVRFSSVVARFSRSLSRALALNLRASWDERKGEGEVGGFLARDSETWRAGFSITHRLGNNTSLNYGYEFMSRDSALAGDEFDENRILFSVRHQF